MSDGQVAIRIRRGALYLSREVCDRYFAGADAVILLRRDADLLVLPVRHAAAGGYLLKQRNGAGDRVVHAADLLRDETDAGEDDRELPAFWDPAQAGLVVESALSAN